jgi:hypothetical protein
MMWCTDPLLGRDLEAGNVYSRCYAVGGYNNILWRIDPLLRGDHVNSSRCNDRGGVTMTDENSRCYVEPAAYACAVTSHNSKREDAGGVLCVSAPRLYDSTD